MYSNTFPSMLTSVSRSHSSDTGAGLSGEMADARPREERGEMSMGTFVTAKSGKAVTDNEGPTKRTQESTLLAKETIWALRIMQQWKHQMCLNPCVHDDGRQAATETLPGHLWRTPGNWPMKIIPETERESNADPLCPPWSVTQNVLWLPWLEKPGHSSYRTCYTAHFADFTLRHIQ